MGGDSGVNSRAGAVAGRNITSVPSRTPSGRSRETGGSGAAARERNAIRRRRAQNRLAASRARNAR